MLYNILSKENIDYSDNFVVLAKINHVFNNLLHYKVNYKIFIKEMNYIKMKYLNWTGQL